MKNVKKLLLSLILFCGVLFIVTPSVVSAGGMPEALSSKGKKNAKDLYKYLISNGFTPEAACGVLGNADQESSLETPIDCAGKHKGIFQFEGAVANAITKWAEKNKLDKNSPITQFTYLAVDILPHDFKHYSDISYSKFKKLKDAEEATDAFCAAYERCVRKKNIQPDDANHCKHAKNQNAYYQELKTRRKYANAFMKFCAGIDPVKKNDNKKDTGKDNIIVSNGVYGYKDPMTGKFRNLQESAIKFIDENKIGKQQHRGIAEWKESIDLEEQQSAYGFLRKMVMFVGILFLVWVVLIYLSYWYDRINTLIDIQLLPIVTGGMLRVSPEEDRCEFNPKEMIVGKQQTVNLKVITAICLLGIFFAILVISGKIYTLLAWFVYGILKLLN